MKVFSKQRIATQLIVRFVPLGLGALLVLSLTSYFYSKQAMLDRSFEQLTSIRETKRMQLADFFENQISTIEVMSELPVVTRSIQAYDSVYNLGVQSHPYASVNQYYDRYLARIKETFGFYDLFLVNLSGDIVYTVVHEPDFATNLRTGPYHDQNIAIAYQQGLKTTTMVDFAHYAPSNGDPASFVSSPIHGENGSIIGVLIGQVPLDKINAITQERTGLGETGETYLVGADYIMRSDSRFSEESTVLKLKTETQAVKEALQGSSGTEIILDYRGVSVLSSYAPLQVGDLTYAILTEIDIAEVLAPVQHLRNLIIVITLLACVLIAGTAYLLAQRFTRPIKRMQANLEKLAQGVLVEDNATETRHDELGDMAQAMSSMVRGLHQTADFATSIGQGNLDKDYQPLSDEDTLGNALVKMRDQLQRNSEEAERRNWTTEGLAKFAEILRNTSDVEELGNQVLIQLIEYLQVNQGAIFATEESEQEVQLEMIACYAYHRKKYLSKTLLPGEGIVGQTYLEKETTYLTEIPQDYMQIRSGLGGANPAALLVVPLKVEDQVEGVLELASLTPFAEHEILFIEKVAESIGSALRNAKVSAQTQRLLQASQEQTEAMQAQEEEMRQNMEELAATQEEMRRKEQGYLERIEQLEAETS